MWGLLPCHPWHVKHIPLPHPSDNSDMEKNRRGSALVSSLPCTVLLHTHLHSWWLMVMQRNSPLLVSPPLLAASQSHSHAGKDEVCFPALYYILCIIFRTWFFRVRKWDLTCCEIQRTGPRWLSQAKCDSHKLSWRGHEEAWKLHDISCKHVTFNLYYCLILWLHNVFPTFP